MTELGILIVSKLKHESEAVLPIISMLSGIVTDVSVVHCINAAAPIVFTG
jgi:hypothetical protein